jgi:peptide-methionine (S)-S-oxide reductase
MHPRDRNLLPRRVFLAGALTVLAALALVPLSGVWRPASAEQAEVVPPPAVDEPLAATGGTQTAVIAGGCFWGVQGVFQHTNGVIQAVSGYSGGAKETAIYEVVTSGETGHAESVEITYDPSKITYGRLLQIYFSVAHNPTQLNYQGPDQGTQYRSAIFTTNDKQAEVAKAYIVQLDAAKVFEAPIVTQVNPLEAFYTAEDYHQDYATLHPDQPYIAYHDLPKIENLKRLFPEVYRETPVLVRTADNTQ